jgi:hypothetical protein
VSLGRMCFAKLLTILLALVVMVSYYHLEGRWVELWASAGLALRYCVPLGLNNRAGFHTARTHPKTWLRNVSRLFGPNLRFFNPYIRVERVYYQTPRTLLNERREQTCSGSHMHTRDFRQQWARGVSRPNQATIASSKLTLFPFSQL